MAPVALVPSPKFHAYPATVPSGSLDPDPLTATVRPLTVGVPITAVGGWFTGGGAATVTERVTEPVAPLSSVTVNVTVNVPSAVYVWLAVAPVALDPSPNAHAYPATVPSGSLDPDPLTAAVRPLTVGVPITADGGWFTGGGAVPSRDTVNLSNDSTDAALAELDV